MASKWKVQVTGIGEMVWSENAMRYASKDNAEVAAYELASRWFGMDMARVVPEETPNLSEVDLTDPTIVFNRRSK